VNRRNRVRDGERYVHRIESHDTPISEIARRRRERLRRLSQPVSRADSGDEK
jgi:hypothetical protein